MAEDNSSSRRKFLAGAASIGVLGTAGSSLGSIPGQRSQTQLPDILNTVVAEIGKVGGATGEWQTQQYSNGLVDAILSLASPVPPIVVAKPPTDNGADPCHVRIRDVTQQGFQYKIEEWDYLDGSHTTESFHYFAVIPGVYNLGTDTVQTGGVLGLEANRIPVSSAPQDVSFDFNQIPQGGFTNPPVVMAQSQTRHGTNNAIVTHVDAPSPFGFNVRVQEQEAEIKNRIQGTPVPDARYYHETETVGYIAVAQGSGSVAGGLLDPVLDLIAGDFVANRQLVGSYQTPGAEFERINFGQGRFDNTPAFVGGIQSRNGPEPAELRYRDLTQDGVDIKIEEEQSFDSEVNHANEDVGYLAFEDTGLIEGIDLL